MDKQYLPNKKSQAYYANQGPDTGVNRCAGENCPDHGTLYIDREATRADSNNEMVAPSRGVHVPAKRQISIKSVQSRKKCRKGGRQRREIAVEEVS